MEPNITKDINIKNVRKVSVKELENIIFEICNEILLEQERGHAHHQTLINVTELNGNFVVTLTNVQPERVENLINMMKEDIKMYLNSKHINFYGLTSIYSNGNNKIKVWFSSPKLNIKEFEKYVKKELFDYLYYA